MLLDTFFLRYMADTGQAVKDVNALDAAEAKRNKNKKKSEADEDKNHKTNKKRNKEAVDDTKKLTKTQEELQKAGKESFNDLLKGGGKFGMLLSKLGPLGLAAAAGVAAIAGAVAVAFAGIDEARNAAKEAVDLGDKAYAARLAQNELIRLQNQGRRRGLADEETSASAAGTYNKGSEIRAAQRQAARDPASAFNNPLIKAGNLFKKAGVDVSAALETQIAQQDKYLQSLVKNGQEERALVEGVELFGRSLRDVRSVLADTSNQAAVSAVNIAKDNNRRRDLQKTSAELAVAEGKLEAERKKNDERVTSKTVPATKEFTQALTEWEEAISPLMDTWGEFVAALIGGLTNLVTAAKEFGQWTGLLDDPKAELAETRKEKALKESDTSIEMKYRLQRGRGPVSPQEQERMEAEKAEARKVVGAKFDTEEGAKQDERKKKVPAQIDKAVENVVEKKDGKQLFEGKEVSNEQIETAKARAREAIEKDPTADLQEETNTILRDMLAKATESGKVQDAQTALTRQIESNTAPLINTGLDQAMALWAGGLGKAANVGAGSFQGEDRTSYEARILNMRRTVNPNLARQADEGRGTVAPQAPEVAKQKPTPPPAISKVPAVTAPHDTYTFAAPEAPPLTTGPSKGTQQEPVEPKVNLAPMPNIAHDIDKTRNLIMAIPGQVKRAQGTANEVTQQAAAINNADAARAQAPASKGDITMGDVNVHLKTDASDGPGVARELGDSLASHLPYVIGDFASPVVS